MKNIWLVAILACMSAIAWAGPKIAVPETHWDYGNVPQNALLVHGYIVKNIGDDTLHIIDVKPG